MSLSAAACEQLSVTRCDFTPRLEEDAAAARSSLTDQTRLSAGVRQQKRRRDGASGRVRRREGRELHLRSGRFLHVSPHPPQAAVVGKLWVTINEIGLPALPSLLPSSSPCLHSQALSLLNALCFLIQTGMYSYKPVFSC